jgi:hypothetical protein
VIPGAIKLEMKPQRESAHVDHVPQQGSDRSYHKMVQTQCFDTAGFDSAGIDVDGFFSAGLSLAPTQQA